MKPEKRICCIIIPHLYAEAAKISEAYCGSNTPEPKNIFKPIIVATGAEDNDTVIDFDPCFDKFLDSSGLRSNAPRKLEKGITIHNFMAITGYNREDFKLVKPHSVPVEKIEKKLVSLLKQFSPRVEPITAWKYSLDLTGTSRLFGRPIDSAKNLINRIKGHFGLTARAGIGENILIASTAAELAEDMGVYEIPSPSGKLFTAQLPISIVPLLPDSIKKTLAKVYNITSFGDIAKLSRDELISITPRYGNMLYAYLHGKPEDSGPVDIKNKKIRLKIAFPSSSDDRTVMKGILDALFEVSLEIYKLDAFPGRFSISVIYQDNYSTTLYGSFKKSPNNISLEKTMLKDMQPHLKNILKRRTKIKTILLTLFDFREAGGLKSLFPDMVTPGGLEKAISSITEKYGKEFIHYGS